MSALTHRAVISRDTSTGTDAWNRPVPSVFTVQPKSVPCRAWSKNRREIRDDGKMMIVEDIRAMFSMSADVQEGDRVTVNDRLGNVIFDSLAIQSISRHGANVRHRQAMMERHK